MYEYTERLLKGMRVMCRVCVCTRMMYTKGPLMRFINKLGIVNPGIRRKGKNTNRPGQYIITLPIYKGRQKSHFSRDTQIFRPVCRVHYISALVRSAPWSVEIMECGTYKVNDRNGIQRYTYYG